MYYTLTTLSTVGFGDMKPLNSGEYIFCAPIMLLGVAIISYIISLFLNIIVTFKSIDADHDHSDEL